MSTTALFAPGNYSGQPYVAPNLDVTRTPTHKVAIVYSDTTAANYFRGLGDAAGAPSTAYSDLFMAAQNQARMAGVSYDVIDESQLTNVNNLIGYDALIFPAMANVNTAQLPAIMSALTSAVYDYHIGIITSGDFLTNDQTGAALAGNPTPKCRPCWVSPRTSGGNSGDVTVTAADVSNPIMAGYSAGRDHPALQWCRLYRLHSLGHHAIRRAGQPERRRCRQRAGCGRDHGRRRHQRAFRHPGSAGRQQSAVRMPSRAWCSAPAPVSRCTRPAWRGSWLRAWTWTRRRIPADVSPARRKRARGIYDKLIPILTQWKEQYDFVGSYYVDIGDNPNPSDPNVDPTRTNWQKSLPYYQADPSAGRRDRLALLSPI